MCPVTAITPPFHRPNIRQNSPSLHAPFPSPRRFSATVFGMKFSPTFPLLALTVLSAVPAAIAQSPLTIPLPTSKQLHLPEPGAPQSLNSLPMAAAWSPDHRYLALVNAGFGTLESGYDQSLAILDTATGKVADFPQPFTALGAAQTLYSGIAFSTDGSHLYVTVDSLSAPTGGQPDGQSDHMGNGILVYRFRSGAPQFDHLIPIGLQPLPPGAHQNQFGAPIPANKAIPAPAGIAIVPAHDGQPEQLLVADNFSDDVLLIDPARATILHRFDLSAPPSAPNATVTVPSTYPVAVLADSASHFAYVALWNASAVARLDLARNTVVQTLPLLPPVHPVEPGSHPAALALSPDNHLLYVALANRDAVAVVRLAPAAMQLAATLTTRLPAQHFFGAMPDALALSADGSRLYAANTGSDAVAVLNARPATNTAAASPSSAPLGFIPTDWYPTALAIRGNHLYIATAKGQGTGPNATPPQIPDSVTGPGINRLRHRPAAKGTYIATLLHGSLASIDLAHIDLSALTRQAIADNRIAAPQPTLHFAAGTNPIRHVIYIIRENRTYDQDLGDLSLNGQPVGNGDPALTIYGASITPNLHKLALQFGVLDNFYDSGEVSGDGHVWSTAAITSDYTEKTWQQSYRGRERPYDYEGVVEQGYPLLEKIPDIDEPDSGYLWTDLARHHVSLYHFGEFISTKFCDDSGEAPKDPSPLNGTPEPRPEHCDHPAILPGSPIPARYGGGRSPYPWKIPLIYRNVATKPELQGHFDPDYADFNLSFPDQLRFEEFASHFRHWVATRQSTGHDPMPAFVMLRFPNDHTAGTTPGMPTPRASVADNDLAVGRTVEAISHSPYWNDTAIFVLEDDAQDGADHVDAHRSLALVISKYSPRQSQPVVDSHFYTTVSVLRTMEELLGVPPMNNNDAYAPAIAPLFTGTGNQPAYTADTSNRDNGLIYTANTRRSPGARASSKMDFTHEDRANPYQLNVILWRDARGNTPLPPQLRDSTPENATAAPRDTDD